MFWEVSWYELWAFITAAKELKPSQIFSMISLNFCIVTILSTTVENHTTTSRKTSVHIEHSNSYPPISQLRFLYYVMNIMISFKSLWKPLMFYTQYYHLCATHSNSVLFWCLWFNRDILSLHLLFCLNAMQLQ